MTGKSEKNKPQKNSRDNDLDLDYLRRGFEMTPTERLQSLERLMEFLNATMSPQAKENAERLKKAGF